MDSEKGISWKEQGIARPGGSHIVGRIPKEVGGKRRGAMRRQAVPEAWEQGRGGGTPQQRVAWLGNAGLPFQNLAPALTQNRDSHSL